MNPNSTGADGRAGRSRLSQIAALFVVLIVIVVAATILMRRGKPSAPAGQPSGQPVVETVVGGIRTVPVVGTETEEAATPGKEMPAARSPRLVVASDPLGATVAVDGHDYGVTPLGITGLRRGTHRIDLRLAGYVPYKQVIDLGASAGPEARLSAKLEPLPRGLTVTTVPPGARVSVENRDSGESPLKLADLKAGTYRVRVEMPGYAPQERVITLPEGEARVEEFHLQRRLGALVLAEGEPGVTVVINGQPAAVSRVDGQDAGIVDLNSIEPGAHTVQLSKPGFVTRTLVVNVGTGKTVRVNAQLERAFTANYEVQTVDGSIYRGRLKRIDDSGTVRIEIAPGQYRNIPANVIAAQKPLAAP